MTDLPPADDGARRAAQPPKRGSWGIRLAGAALLLVLLAVSALIALRTEGGWRNVDARIEALQPVLVTIHLTLIGLLWWRWEALVNWLCRRRQSPEELRQLALGMRGRVVFMLLAFEVLVVLQWPFKWL